MATIAVDSGSPVTNATPGTAHRTTAVVSRPVASAAVLPTVLVVDDEQRSQETLRRTLDEEFEVITAGSATEAQGIMERDWVQVILCDQRMPGMTGVEFLQVVRERWPNTVRMIISGYTDSDDIISSINEAGIYQFILKPWQPESLLLAVRSGAQLYRLQQENALLAAELRTAPPVLRKRLQTQRAMLRSQNAFARIIRGAGSPLNGLCDMAARVAGHDISILITGESGTGKELMARAIHYNSARADGPFVTENCGAMHDQLLESELFGHKRGSFTGAYEDRIGLFQQADGGTIFLDEIGETSPAFQVKLLRVLQEGEIRPVGCSRTQKIDVRLITATNRDLEADVRNGRFREDLYYRINNFSLHVPPLRARSMDVPLIAYELLEVAGRSLGKPALGFTPEALECLCAYRWPGNVRELHNEVQRMLALTDEPYLGAALLSPRVLRAAAEEDEQDLRQLAGLNGTLKQRMETLERQVVRETLIRHRWNKSRAASELGLSRVGLRSKLARYGLERKSE